MSRILLLKHALPEIVPDLPAKLWQLGESGRAQSRVLAETLRPYKPSVIITSDEPKAVATGQIVADALELPYSTVPGLHEHDIGETPYFENPEAFAKAVKALFAEPDRRAYGNESAAEALERFSGAVDKALEPYPGQDVVIVAHGRVGTIFVAAHNPVETFSFWQGWRVGTFVVLSRPDYGLLEPPRPAL